MDSLIFQFGFKQDRFSFQFPQDIGSHGFAGPFAFHQDGILLARYYNVNLLIGIPPVANIYRDKWQFAG